MSSYKIGVNLRVTENSNQGGRKYMEDNHAIRFVKSDEGGFEFAYFGIFDGHGGSEASKFARDNLLDQITKYQAFWSENDDDVLFAIKNGFLDTHYAMWKEVDKWPRTFSGHPSTSGTTGSVAIIKNSKLYIGHVGDSGVALGYDESKSEKFIRPKGTMLTIDHKPDSPEEKNRIEKSGGQVIAKAGVQRVVWNRPKVTHKGPIRRSTPIDKIPFLAVARSLGDLWSYNYYNEEFVVSPVPDVSVYNLDPSRDKCLILGSDGLWNMVTAEEAVSMVVDLEYHFEYKVINDPSVSVSYWINPAERLVQRALNKWRAKLMRADNTSCIVVLIDPLGPRKLSILKKKRDETMKKLLESKTTAVSDDSKHNLRTSPRKSQGDVCSSESKESPDDPAFIEPKTKPELKERWSISSDAGLGVGLGVSKPALSPVSMEKMRRHSIPGIVDGDLDDSIQATSVHKKLTFTPATGSVKDDMSISHLTGTNISGKRSCKLLDGGKVESPRKLLSYTRTRHLSGNTAQSAVNRVKSCPVSQNPTSAKKEVFTASALKDLSVLTDSLKPYQSNKPLLFMNKPMCKGVSSANSCSFPHVCTDSVEFKIQTSDDINRKLGKKDLSQNRKEEKKIVKANPKDTPSHNLRRTVTHSSVSSDKKGVSSIAARLRKVKQRSLRYRGQVENKLVVTRDKLCGVKRKRVSQEGVPQTKKACRR